MCPSTHKVHAHVHTDKAWKEEEGYDICLLNRIEACQRDIRSCGPALTPWGCRCRVAAKLDFAACLNYGYAQFIFQIFFLSSLLKTCCKHSELRRKETFLNLAFAAVATRDTFFNLHMQHTTLLFVVFKIKECLKVMTFTTATNSSSLLALSWAMQWHPCMRMKRAQTIFLPEGLLLLISDRLWLHFDFAVLWFSADLACRAANPENVYLERRMIRRKEKRSCCFAFWEQYNELLEK